VESAENTGAPGKGEEKTARTEEKPTKPGKHQIAPSNRGIKHLNNLTPMEFAEKMMMDKKAA